MTTPSQIDLLAHRSSTLQQGLRVLVPTDWTNDRKGAFLEDLAGQILRRQSYEVVERIRFTGMEIDLLGRHTPSGDQVYVECKFHERPFSANIVDLMVAQAYRRRIERVALFSTSGPGKEASGVIEELRSDDRLSFSFYGPDQILRALVDSAAAPPLPQNIPASVSHALLLVHPEQEKLWLLQQEEEGRPVRILVSGSYRDLRDLEPLREILHRHAVLQGLPLTKFEPGGNSPVQATQVAEAPQEMVSTVVTAEDLVDYRPCRPQDFVGRSDLQKEIWGFLGDVRGGGSATRLLALTGASGHGKSSLVAKLSHRFRNQKWKRKYFLYPVDVRSARGPLFVAEATLSGIRAAGQAGFLNIPDDLRIDDADSVLAGRSVQAVLNQLRDDRRVLVLFFDQFEEAFTKDALFPVFRAFRRVALDVQAAQENLVFGFSWRTGISLSNDNPAYQLWNELRDHRLTKVLEQFAPGEASHLISTFEKAMRTKLLPPLRRRIHEQGQGLPWFLKKLCIHVYSEIDRGVSQIDLLGSRLNVEALFAEDLEPLSEAQLQCIRVIAQNSPADALDVYEHFGEDVVSDLIEKRLVVRAGPKFAVYWDIFRDYLTDGRVPFIPLTYIPTSSLRMALSACKALGRHGPMTADALADELGYVNATAVNIATDLQNLALCGRTERGAYQLLPGSSLNHLADRLRSQLLEHVLYQALLQDAGPSGELSRQAGVRIVRNLYASSQVKSKTRDNYLTRLLPWFEFAGLLTGRTRLTVYSGDTKGGGFGEAPAGRKERGPAAFLGTAPPERAQRLLAALLDRGSIAREDLAEEFGRNEASDLVALQLARWSSGRLEMTRGAQERGLTADAMIKTAVLEDPTLRAFDQLIRVHPDASRTEIGGFLGDTLDRSWLASSAQRYSSGLWRYREFAGAGRLRSVPTTSE